VLVKINGEQHYFWRAVDHERGGSRKLWYKAP
jgi:transposase-like protein